ncbi:flavodoxin family protein [Paenibacillus agilis]|uniref:Flavodoxin family protein n=1 Tax=Paenibacillus agilis TaxID=3020863 RepID=A0A559IHZ4_9BACL|nr:flavodoxin family protein [Paenibacillus agilis]TVX87130.1 flavodoxin family protein [Paenibacillus agilis]
MFIIQGSARERGNTEQLTELLTEGLDVTTIRLREYEIEQIVDKRHAPEGFEPIEGELRTIVEQMLEHDTLVFATPLYWYGMSGSMKVFIDRWSQCLRDEQLQFKERMKGKKVYLVVVGGPNAKMTGLAFVQQFRHICEFMGMSFEGWIIGRGSKPGDVLEDKQTIAEVQQLNLQFRQLQS